MTLVPLLKVVETAIGPGKSADTTPDAAILPRIWEIKTKAARGQVTAPMSAMPSVTAGLKRPERHRSVSYFSILNLLITHLR